MFHYDPGLADAISRTRDTVGDTAAPGLKPDETYQAMLAAHTTTTTGDDGEPTTTTDEAAAARDMARSLAAWAGTQPDTIADGGSRLSWTKRIDQWNRIADGQAGGAKSTPSAKGFTIRRGPARDYSTGKGDQV